MSIQELKLSVRLQVIKGAYAVSYSGEKPSGGSSSGYWGEWVRAPGHECPANINWLQVLFPNAQIDITNAHFANADVSASSSPPSALVKKFTRIPHGKSATDVTRVTFDTNIFLMLDY